MASAPFRTVVRSAGGRSFDAPVAAFAGLAVAFAAYVMPADLLAALVSATPLPDLVPAAAPPLGQTARIAVSGIGAIAMFAGVFVLLRWIERVGRKPKVRMEPAPEPEGEMPPRLRRRDLHPDAPPRPPLLAQRDLGEPASAVSRQIAPEPEPAWLKDEELVLGETAGPEFEDQCEPVEAPQTIWPTQEDQPASEPAEPICSTPEPSQPAAAPPSAIPPSEDSISALMARLENGLAQRRSDRAPAEPLKEEAGETPRPSGDDATDRLEAALADLQRLAARP